MGIFPRTWKTDDEGIPDNLIKQSKQRKFDPGMWESPPMSEVEKLPLGIDGLVKNTIVKAKTSKEISAVLLADGRKWKTSETISDSAECYEGL